MRAETKALFARPRGETIVAPFVPSVDVVNVGASPSRGLFDGLLRSGFIPREWVLRSNATHGKSKVRSLDAAEELLGTSM